MSMVGLSGFMAGEGILYASTKRTVAKSHTMSFTAALILNEINKPFTVGEVKLGSLHDEEAPIEIQVTSICHTYLCADGTGPAAIPAVLGHEGDCLHNSQD